MSAIAGIVRFDAGPANTELDRMAARMRLRGYQGIVARHDGGGLMGGRRENLIADASIAIAFDGRLDNRDELIDRLNVAADASDAMLAHAAFRSWGTSAAARLDGDFAIGAVDLRERRLVCARDRFGVRCLFYRLGPGWVAFASSIDILAAGIEPLPSINEGMIGEYLSFFIVSTRETLFENIYRVAPAHQLVADDRHQSQEEYWRPPVRALRRQNDAQLEEEARDLLGDAVRKRLRGVDVAGVMLSGGLDSSSVTALAAEAVRDRQVETRRIETFSGSVPGPEDEQPFADAVSKRWDLQAHVITEQRPRASQFADEIALDLEPQMFPHSPTIDVIRTLARQRGIRVMFTGSGGDDWFGSGPAAYGDLIAHGRLLALIDRLRMDMRADSFPGWRLTLQPMLWPFMPARAQQLVRTVLRRGGPPPWIDLAFAKRIALADRFAQFRSERRFATRELDDNWFQTVHGMHVYTSEIVTRGGDRFGLEIAHPFFDRRIVEFGLTLPGDQLWRDGRAKDLLRRAMRSRLPDVVTGRWTNPAADHSYIHAIESEMGDHPFTGLQVEARGWLNGTEIRRMWSTLRATPGRAAHEGRILWGCQAVELWLRARTMVKYS